MERLCDRALFFEFNCPIDSNAAGLGSVSLIYQGCFLNLASSEEELIMKTGILFNPLLNESK